MIAIQDILTLERTVCHARGGSKKRLFETIAGIASDDQPALLYDDVLDHLIAREKLGSTGLGQGIAIPHCRVEQVTQPLGILLSLDEPIAYDAPDELPVDLFFVLLVPLEGEQVHLDILAELARLFSQAEFCTGLRNAQDAAGLFEFAIAASGGD